MANFDKAYKRVQQVEGGYVNDPDDRGGETYKGISRRAHPDSEIWNIIDNAKKEHKTKNINDILKYNDVLQKLIKNIYKYEYWDVFNLDKLKNQGIANEIFDDAVNRGVGGACSILCDTLGISRVSRPTPELLRVLHEYER